MKTIIAGGRDYKVTVEDFKWLDTLGITEVVSGGAKGADFGGECYSRSRGLPLRIFPADWNTFGKSAGLRRNAQMAEYAEAVALFPGGKGTAHMETTARLKGLKVHKR